MKFFLLLCLTMICGSAVAGDDSARDWHIQGVATTKENPCGCAPHGKKYSMRFTMGSSGKPIPNYPYRLVSEDGQVLRGLTDENGQTENIWTATPQKITMFYDDARQPTDDSDDDVDDTDGLDLDENTENEPDPDAENFTVNDVKIYYSPPLNLATSCGTFLRHPVETLPAGWEVGLSDSQCSKYGTAQNDEVITNYYKGKPDVWLPVRKKDLISLAEFPAWNGTPPVRARFEISTPAYRRSWFAPYAEDRHVFDYTVIDRNGREINLGSGKETGYAFYQFLDICYLATIEKPRNYTWKTPCQRKGNSKDKNMYESFLKHDTSNHPWINVTEHNIDESDFPDLRIVGIPGNMPVRPLIFSDEPITDDGRVSKGRAMCMADCPDGMLMKLLHEGQSIWGESGRK